MARGPIITIELGQQTLRAIQVRTDRDRLHVEHACVLEVPAEYADDAETLGRWAGEQLTAHDFARGKATWVLSRERVGFKRLTLPTDDPAELPDMVRLAMQRDLSFDAADAVIDFVPGDAADGSTGVIAAAAPLEAITHTQAIAKVSGFGVDRIALRSMGTAALVRGLDADTAGDDTQGTLAIDVRPTNVEFAVIADGSVWFSRAIDMPPGDTPEEIAENVLTETQRTWMSYRLSHGAVDVHNAIIVGDEAIARACIERVRTILDRPVKRVDAHPEIDSNGSTMRGLWPLAGVVLEAHKDAPTIDFAHPRQAPDHEAERRKRLLFGAGIAAVVALAVWTFAKRDLDGLQTRIDELTQQRNDMTPDYMRYTRNVLKRDHLEHWEDVQVNWLAHLRQLCEIAPGAKQVVLDQWSGSLNFRGVQWDKRTDAGERWNAPSEVTINVSGEAIDRATADAFRETLVNNDIYATTSTGTDQPGGKRLPFGFDYRLRTRPGTLPDASDDGRTALAQETGS